MTKTYTFYDDSWWDWPPCDCCQGGLIECYNSSDTGCNLGSAHSLEDCYVQAIITEVDEDYETTAKYYEMTLEQLEVKAQELGIEIKVIS